VFSTAFLFLRSGFVIFSKKNIGTKGARKMLVQLTAGVNFISKCTHSFYPIILSASQLLFHQINYASWHAQFFLDTLLSFTLFAMCQQDHLLAKISACKMLVKLTRGVNLTYVF